MAMLMMASLIEKKIRMIMIYEREFNIMMMNILIIIRNDQDNIKDDDDIIYNQEILAIIMIMKGKWRIRILMMMMNKYQGR